MKNMKAKKIAKPTYCWICNERTGFGFGVEPMRYDTICCSSKCAKIINNPAKAKQHGITYLNLK